MRFSAIDWSFLAGIGAILTAGVAIYQAWLLRSSNIATLILKFDDKFNKEMIDTRKKAACALQHQSLPDGKNEIEDILDFCETLGMMVRRRAIDKKIVWHTFFYWLHGYHVYDKDFIEDQRKNFPSRYEDLIYLHTKTCRLEERRRAPINEAEWSDFLREEQGG